MKIIANPFNRKRPRRLIASYRAYLQTFGLIFSWLLVATIIPPAKSKQSYQRIDEPPPGKRFICGYDALGAEDEWLNHKLNALRSNGRAFFDQQANSTAGPRVESYGDIAVIEDDVTVVMPPNKFDLKNTSLLFTPDGDGFRVARAEVEFNKDFGFRLNYFFSARHTLTDFDNGYRDMELLDAQFPFFGVYYDTVFIGTNGYVTFTDGDTSGRPSAAALASTLPRIAPLWADLNANNTGDLYYKRLEGRHVITWNRVPQSQYPDTSTFQLVLYDDGKIAFVYKKVKARSALIGISPGGSNQDPRPVDISAPPSEAIRGAFFESFSKGKRLDLPAVTRAFYRAHADLFDTIYVWSDFPFDNGLGVAHSFNVRNDIKGIGLNIFDRGSVYGSASRLSTLITMGNIKDDWPADPGAHVVGLNSAISIVCHEHGHRWLAYVRFDAEHDIKDDLLGRQMAHWSFLADTRTNSEGSFSSLMEGNAWRDNSNGTFTTVETAVNYFSELDQYLMGLRPAEEVGGIPYLVVDRDIKELLRSKSPVSGFSVNATRKTTSVAQIVEREGRRVPDASSAPKDFRIAFIVVTERGTAPSPTTIDKLDRYRSALVRYFSVATGRRGSLDSSLTDSQTPDM